MRRIFSRAMRNLLFGAQTTTTSRRETRATYEKKKKKKKKAAVGWTYRESPCESREKRVFSFLVREEEDDGFSKYPAFSLCCVSRNVPAILMNAHLLVQHSTAHYWWFCDKTGRVHLGLYTLWWIRLLRIMVPAGWLRVRPWYTFSRLLCNSLQSYERSRQAVDSVLYTWRVLLLLQS